MYYFLSLAGFDPLLGVLKNIKEESLFISPREGVFSPTIRPTEYYTYDWFFPFDRIELDDDRSFLLSEQNLQRLFHSEWENSYKLTSTIYKTDGRTNRPVSTTEKEISPNFILELKEHFYTGYKAGLENFQREIGIVFPLQSLVRQEAMLKNFMNYCHDQLYFEGYVSQRLLSCLGYIQANYVLAYKEYNNLCDIIFVENPPWLVKETDRQSSTLPTINKISINYPMDQIISLWMVLLDVHKCSELELVQEFHSEETIRSMLGSMFTNNSGIGEIPDAPHRRYELSKNYKKILDLLMHATFKLNQSKGSKSTLPEYGKLLISTFSAYEGKPESVKSNITYNQRDTILALKRFKDSDRIRETLEILYDEPTNWYKADINSEILERKPPRKIK